MKVLLNHCSIFISICAICCISFTPHVTMAQEKPNAVYVTITDSGFKPNRLTLHDGQPVHLIVKNTGHAIHEFAIPEYRIYTRNLSHGEQSDIEFSPWKVGSFIMYSDPAADIQPQFQGLFIVVKP